MYFHRLLPLLMLGLVACTPTISPAPPSASPIASPATTIVPAQVNRVVAMTSLSADILHRLDQTKLVGIPGNRLLRQNPAFAKVPTVSEGRSQPNLEKILELKPDLVIGAAGFHDQTLAKLNSLGVPTLTTKVDRWQDLEALTRELATAVQADPTLLLKDYQTLLPATPVAKPSTLVLVSRQPLLSPNKASWAGDLLARFGANNLATNLQGQSPMQGYITLSPEKVLEADPEVLILVDVGDGEIQKLKAEPFWNQLKATKSNQVYVFDYYGLVNPGSVETIAQASKKLKQVFAAQ